MDNQDLAGCQFLSDPVVVQNEPELLFQYWIENNRSSLYEPTLPDVPSLHEFIDQIRRLVDTDPIVLLAEQRLRVSGPDSMNVNLALKGEAGLIRDMNCLEALLLGIQTERSTALGYSMYSNPTEFLSYILKKDDLLKIYFYTVDQPGVRGLSIFNEFLDRDRKDGWKVAINIHNHNFFPDSRAIQGGVVPSAADVHYLRNMVTRFGLQGAAITNGFHSIELTQNDFEKFTTWEE